MGRYNLWSPEEDRNTKYVNPDSNPAPALYEHLRVFLHGRSNPNPTLLLGAVSLPIYHVLNISGPAMNVQQSANSESLGPIYQFRRWWRLG